VQVTHLQRQVTTTDQRNHNPLTPSSCPTETHTPLTLSPDTSSRWKAYHHIPYHMCPASPPPPPPLSTPLDPTHRHLQCVCHLPLHILANDVHVTPGSCFATGPPYHSHRYMRAFPTHPHMQVQLMLGVHGFSQAGVELHPLQCSAELTSLVDCPSHSPTSRFLSSDTTNTRGGLDTMLPAATAAPVDIHMHIKPHRCHPASSLTNYLLHKHVIGNT